MPTRREFLQVAAAAAALTAGGAPLGRLAAQQKLDLATLLRFEPVGQVTLLNFTDIHAQLVPLFYREPDTNLGVGDAKGQSHRSTGAAFRNAFRLEARTPASYAFSHEDFAALARDYGKIGGVAHLATLVKAIRAERPGRVLLLDGGDTWQGSYTSFATKGADMVEAMNALGVEAMTAHWEFTYGEARVKELVEGGIKFPFLAGNVRDTEWNEDVFKSTATFERGGVKIAVIGQAFPYTPVANPRWMMPKWSFGIQEERVRAHVEAARKGGADLVVLLSHNGFDVDRKLAARVAGIDVILTGHTHDALPDVTKVGSTLLVAAGSHGKFLARLDLDVKDKRVADFRFRLIPVFADAVPADAEMARLIERLRAPHRATLSTVLGRTDSLLYRRGNFNGTYDDLICQAMLEERDAEIALSPGFRWGETLLPGQEITLESVHNLTSVTYPNVYRTEMTGAQLKEIFEDVADNLFNPDPYYQQGGDMVRVGGLGYTIDVSLPMGRRVSAMTHLKSGQPIAAEKKYVVAGWASVNENTQGPPIWDVVANHVRKRGTVRVEPNRSIRVLGA